MIVFADNAIPLIGSGAISETQVCVPARISPIAYPETILPPRN